MPYTRCLFCEGSGLAMGPESPGLTPVCPRCGGTGLVYTLESVPGTDGGIFRPPPGQEAPAQPVESGAPRPVYDDEVSGTDRWPAMLRVRGTDYVIAIHRSAPSLSVVVYDAQGALCVGITESLDASFNNSAEGLKKACDQIRALSPASGRSLWDHLDDT